MSEKVVRGVCGLSPPGSLRGEILDIDHQNCQNVWEHGFKFRSSFFPLFYYHSCNILKDKYTHARRRAKGVFSLKAVGKDTARIECNLATICPLCVSYGIYGAFPSYRQQYFFLQFVIVDEGCTSSHLSAIFKDAESSRLDEVSKITELFVHVVATHVVHDMAKYIERRIWVQRLSFLGGLFNKDK